jgi:hypothetical protein
MRREERRVKRERGKYLSFILIGGSGNQFRFAAEWRGVLEQRGAREEGLRRGGVQGAYLCHSAHSLVFKHLKKGLKRDFFKFIYLFSFSFLEVGRICRKPRKTSYPPFFSGQ